VRARLTACAAPYSAPALTALHQKAVILQTQCQEHLKKAELALQSGGPAGDAELYMAMAKDAIEKLRSCAADLRQMGQPHEGVARTAEHYKDQLKGVHMALSGSMRRRSGPGELRRLGSPAAASRTPWPGSASRSGS
ncbi:desmoplakin-A-like, partial [Synchiropus picturatus]